MRGCTPNDRKPS